VSTAGHREKLQREYSGTKTAPSSDVPPVVEEVLVSDVRAHLTPRDFVDRKLAELLGYTPPEVAAKWRRVR
jgi:hypothetical protein